MLNWLRKLAGTAAMTDLVLVIGEPPHLPLALLTGLQQHGYQTEGALTGLAGLTAAE